MQNNPLSTIRPLLMACIESICASLCGGVLNGQASFVHALSSAVFPLPLTRCAPSTSPTPSPLPPATSDGTWSMNALNVAITVSPPIPCSDRLASQRSCSSSSPRAATRPPIASGVRCRPRVSSRLRRWLRLPCGGVGIRTGWAVGSGRGAARGLYFSRCSGCGRRSAEQDRLSGLRRGFCRKRRLGRRGGSLDRTEPRRHRREGPNSCLVRGAGFGHPARRRRHFFPVIAHDDRPELDLQPIPRLQHQPPRAILAERPLFLLLQHPKRLAGEIGAVDVLGVEDVAQLVACQPIEPSVVGVKLGAEDGAAILVPLGRRKRRGASVAAGQSGGVPGVTARGLEPGFMLFFQLRPQRLVGIGPQRRPRTAPCPRRCRPVPGRVGQ